MRKPFIAANWKMNKTLGETRSFLTEFIPLVQDVKDIDIIIAPPFTSLQSASELIRNTNIKLSAQDIFYEDKGAYTGAISPVMLKDAGCTYVIIGHSERRQYFKETDEVINKKIKAARQHGLNVIFCIGESLEERESKKTLDILKMEITEGLRDVHLDGVVVAYEPIWAIGTGKTATPEQAQEAHKYIREQLALNYGDRAKEVRILYGGSATPENIDSLMNCEDVDGALVGGASLKADSFARIVKFKRQ
ncbi:MAG: triose-phosphate isomerase [Thermodesulfovibrionales bacterium]|nr:triose-phosphate isomerase [Thermodesulfovibrionales bacterium]